MSAFNNNIFFQTKKQSIHKINLMPGALVTVGVSKFPQCAVAFLAISVPPRVPSAPNIQHVE
jgi:hypothetical protein